MAARAVLRTFMGVRISRAVQEMIWVYPDHVKCFVDKKAVHSAMFVTCDLKLPRLASPQLFVQV
jgi:hypothetical protein